MFRRLLRVPDSSLLIAGCVLAVTAGARPVPAQTAPVPASVPATVPASATATTLAGCVPGDAAIYLEIRGLHRILGTASGAGMAAALFQLIQSAADLAPADSPPAGSAPAQADASGPEHSAGHLFASAVGLPSSSKTIGMLFSGPVAFAADGWSGLSDAIFLAWPADPAALEAELIGQRLAETAGTPVRRYALANGHELACDGRTAVIGRFKRTNAYARTLEVLVGQRSSLADTSEFRERTGSISAGAQMIAYLGRARAGGESYNPLTAWWPDNWPRVKTLALGFVWDPGGAHVKLSARLDPEGRQLTRSEPPIQVLRRLPASVVAVWTQAIDYVGDFRRLRGKLALEPEGFHFDLLERGLEPGIIEKRVLSHLVGDTVMLVDQVTIQPMEASDPAERLVLPVGAVLVETDDPDAVAGALPLIAANFVRLLNSQVPPEQAVAVRQEAVVAEGPLIYSIPLGIQQAGKTRCDLLASLELSWAVADRWLVVASHSQTVRRVVEARRGTGKALGVGDLDKVVEQVVERGGQPRRVLFARPQAGSAMVDTWLEHIARHHPEMLQSQWWERLLRRQRAMGKQIGILARADNGAVEVVETLPDGPARGRLLVGDRILAVDGIKVDPAGALQSLRESVAQRTQPDKVVFLVRRGDKQQEVELPLPREEVEGLRSPVELLRRFSAGCRLFESGSYVLWQPKPDVVDARVDLRYRASESWMSPTSEPAEPIEASAPATEPAAPVTQPAPSAAPPPAAAPPATQPASPPATQAAPVTQPAG